MDVLKESELCAFGGAAQPTACRPTAAATSTRAKPKKRRISAAALAITMLIWHGKMIISKRVSGCY